MRSPPRLAINLPRDWTSSPTGSKPASTSIFRFTASSTALISRVIRLGDLARPHTISAVATRVAAEEEHDEPILPIAPDPAGPAGAAVQLASPVPSAGLGFVVRDRARRAGLDVVSGTYDGFASDLDGDGMFGWWEAYHGLDPTSATGDDGAEAGATIVARPSWARSPVRRPSRSQRASSSSGWRSWGSSACSTSTRRTSRTSSVDASGKLADGRTFDGPVEFKKLLAADEQRLAEAFLEQLATYALRRVMTVDDVQQLRATAESTSDKDYGVRSLVRGLVMSDLFRKR